MLLISVDGLHQQDLAWYAKAYPGSALAVLAHRGLEYSNAQTPFPSDSFPGMVGQVTGGDPRVTGVYYDDTWNHDVFPAGTTKCSGSAPGGEVAYTEADDINQNSIDAGQGLSGLPGSILQMTASPLQVIDPKNLPVDPATCKPVDPNQYLKVNTIFNVAREHGLRTAWSDKHPAYQLWLSDRSQAAAGFVKNYLLAHSAAGNNVAGSPVTVPASGLAKVYAGAASAAFFGVPAGDPRHPDVLGIVQHGVVYTGKKAKIAEHGGDDPQDRDVPILVVLPGLPRGHVIATPVEPPRSPRPCWPCWA